MASIIALASFGTLLAGAVVVLAHGAIKWKHDPDLRLGGIALVAASVN